MKLDVSHAYCNYKAFRHAEQIFDLYLITTKYISTQYCANVNFDILFWKD